MHVYKDLSYKYDLTETYNSDYQKMSRVADLYAAVSDHRHKIGAGIWISSAPVSGGCNERRRHAKLYPYREALHAEQVAIMSARTDIAGGTLYVCRLDTQNEGKFLLARPCYWCCRIMLQSGIDRVVYTTNDDIESFKMSSVAIRDIKTLTRLPLEQRLAG